MNRALTLSTIALAGCAAHAGPPPRAPGPVMDPLMQLRVDVPEDKGPQRVEVLTREIAPGATIPWHIHDGTEVAVLVSGELESLVAGLPPERIERGGYVQFNRGVVHSARNPGEVPARVVITYILDRDAPQRRAAEPQQ
ncbi:MAG: cupin domain-containing protein [Sphingomonadaceae bacterium]